MMKALVVLWGCAWTGIAAFLIAVIGYGISVQQATTGDGFFFGVLVGVALLIGWFPISLVEGAS